MIKVHTEYIDPLSKKVETADVQPHYAVELKDGAPTIIETPSDTVVITSYSYSRAKQEIAVGVSLGGIDKNNAMTLNPDYKEIIYRNISAKYTPELWTKYNLDAGPVGMADLEKIIVEEKPLLNVVAASRWDIAGLSAELIDEQKPVTEALIVEERK